MGQPVRSQAWIRIWTCNRCGKIFSDEAGNTETTAEDQILPAIGHQWEEKVLEEPTEDKEGTTAIVCKNCEAVQENSTKILPKKGHTYTIVSEAVTWTEAVAKAAGIRWTSGNRYDCGRKYLYQTAYGGSRCYGLLDWRIPRR